MSTEGEQGETERTCKRGEDTCEATEKTIELKETEVREGGKTEW